MHTRLHSSKLGPGFFLIKPFIRLILFSPPKGFPALLLWHSYLTISIKFGLPWLLVKKPINLIPFGKELAGKGLASPLKVPNFGGKLGLVIGPINNYSIIQPKLGGKQLVFLRGYNPPFSGLIPFTFF